MKVPRFVYIVDPFSEDVYSGVIQDIFHDPDDGMVLLADHCAFYGNLLKLRVDSDGHFHTFGDLIYEGDSLDE